MKELTQKFYWLILTTTITLLFTLFSILIREVTSLEINNPFKINFETWDNDQEPVFTRHQQRLNKLDTLYNVLKINKEHKDVFIEKSFSESLGYIKEIEIDALILDALIQEKGNEVIARTMKIPELLTAVKESILLEKAIWELNGKFIVDYRNRKDNIIGDYVYDYNRYRNKLFANLGYGSISNMEYPSGFRVFLKFASDPFKILFLIGIIYAIFLFIGKALYPMGVELWQEEETKRRKQKKKGKKKKQSTNID